VKWEDDEVDDRPYYGIGLYSTHNLVAGETRFLDWEPRPGSSYYQPMEDHPELFKVFADLDGSEDAFAEFATEFGLLGVSVLTKSGYWKEPLWVWRKAWLEVAGCSRLLTLSKGRTIESLRGLISIDDESAELKFTPSAYAPIPLSLAAWMKAANLPQNSSLAMQSCPDIWAALHSAKSEAAQLRMAARFWVQVTTNLWMGGWELDEVKTVSSVIADERGESWQIRSSPNCLAAALWLQVARALEGDVDHKQCANPKCRKWFLISGDRDKGRRTDAKYCADPKCRKAVYRAKRREQSRKGRSR
jgi:hypothetical protein